MPHSMSVNMEGFVYDNGTSPTPVFSRDAPHSNAGKFAIPLSLGFTGHSSHPNNMEFSVEATFGYSKKSGPVAIFRDSNKVWALSDYPKYGFDTLDGVGFEEWKAPKQILESVASNRNIGVWEGAKFVPDYIKFGMTNVNVPITPTEWNIPINLAGPYASRMRNLRQTLWNLNSANYLFERPGVNRETGAWIEFMEGKGDGPPREIRYLGVETMGNAIARTYYLEDGSVALVASTDIHDKALAMAHRHGLEGEAAARFAERFIWLHEYKHVWDRTESSKSAKEIAVGEDLAEFAEGRASLLEGKLAGFYRAMAAENRDYAKGWRSGKLKGSASLRSRVEYLARKYVSEARARGMDEEEIREYIASNLKEELDKEASNLEERAEGETGKREYANDNSEERIDENNRPESGHGPAEEDCAADGGPEEATDDNKTAANDNPDPADDAQESEAA